jgi:hypothetical protein
MGSEFIDFEIFYQLGTYAARATSVLVWDTPIKMADGDIHQYVLSLKVKGPTDTLTCTHTHTSCVPRWCLDHLGQTCVIQWSAGALGSQAEPRTHC